MERKLVIVGGLGIFNTRNERGKFEIEYSQGKKQFADYFEAKTFYTELNEPSSFWDKTRKAILLELKDWEPS